MFFFLVASPSRLRGNTTTFCQVPRFSSAAIRSIIFQSWLFSARYTFRELIPVPL